MKSDILNLQLVQRFELELQSGKLWFLFKSGVGQIFSLAHLDTKKRRKKERKKGGRGETLL